jgi:hypothetical protein
MTFKASGFAAITTGFGTAIAAIAPQDFVVWSGVFSTFVLGCIALYAKFRDTKRAADLADVQAQSDTWKAKFDRAHGEAEDWRQRALTAQAGSDEWQKLYKASRREPQSDKSSSQACERGSGG